LEACTTVTTELPEIGIEGCVLDLDGRRLSDSASTRGVASAEACERALPRPQRDHLLRTRTFQSAFLSYDEGQIRARDRLLDSRRHADKGEFSFG
jgi:hypothetical protein